MTLHWYIGDMHDISQLWVGGIKFNSVGDDVDYEDNGDDVGDLQSPAELERLHPVPVQTVLLPLVGSMPLSKASCDCHPKTPLETSMVWGLPRSRIITWVTQL